MTQSSTMAREAVTIMDAEGVEETMTHIDGMTLEEYFNSADVMAPVAGEATFMNGVPIGMTDDVPAGAMIMVGKIPVNG